MTQNAVSPDGNLDGGGSQRIVIDLDEETALCLATIGAPSEVIERMARAAADAVRGRHRRHAIGLSREDDSGGADAGGGCGGCDGHDALASGSDSAAARLCDHARACALLVDQREANAKMVAATIRAQEVRDEADWAKRRAEMREVELRDVAEVRELFIGILGHDLRNPLGSIGMAAAQLLRRGHLSAQDAETVARIVRGGQRITTMVTQLLDLTHARLGGGLPIERAATDLRQVCENVVGEFDAHIELSAMGDLRGDWDQDRLAQALSNLSANALEYATPGTVVALTARAEGEEVVVEVSNKGEAIPAAVLPSLFQPFRRARPLEKSAAGNLGLGLYIAHQVVLSHGGTLTATSVEGLTTFTMRLPRRAATDVDPLRVPS